MAAIASLTVVGGLAAWISMHPNQPAFLDQHAIDCNNHIAVYNAAAQKYYQDKSILGASIDNYQSGQTQQDSAAAYTEAQYVNVNCGANISTTP
jgi:phospholipase/lecithinase/hemolysin